MNVAKWLKQLSASYPQHDLSDLQAFEYRQELETWSLDPEQWLELKSLARRRHTFFPSIVELQEIAQEVKRNQAAGQNGKPVWETFIGPDRLVYARRPK